MMLCSIKSFWAEHNQCNVAFIPWLVTDFDFANCKFISIMMTSVVFSCVVCATDWQILYTVQLRRICQTKLFVQYAGFVFVIIFVFVFVFAPLTCKVCISTAEKNLPNQTVCPLRCWIVWLCHYWLGPGALGFKSREVMMRKRWFRENFKKKLMQKMASVVSGSTGSLVSSGSSSGTNEDCVINEDHFSSSCSSLELEDIQEAIEGVG